MVNEQPIQNNEWLENFVDQTLKIHTAISIEISRQLSLVINGLNNFEERKTKLKHALALIDQLDLFLESPSKIKKLYPNIQLELSQVLLELEIPFPLLSGIKGSEIEEVRTQ